jgi:flagellar biosynthesis protein FlhF
MEVQSFMANSAAEAVSQIRDQFGPDAVLYALRKVPSRGLARLWRKPRIQVIAGRPPEAEPAEADQEEYGIGQSVPGEAGPAPFSSGGWRSGALLESVGLAREHVLTVLNAARRRSGGAPPRLFAEETALVREVLRGLWPAAAPMASNRHIFIGPPGSGKTTVACKWLASAVIGQGRRARVWRLDSAVSNTGEFLDLFAETLGVGVERCPDPGRPPDPCEVVLVDLPGVDAHSRPELEDLRGRLAEFRGAAVHLVLNAAYDPGLLLGQARAFRACGYEDILLTHLDEAPRWMTAWNLVLGTSCSVSHISAGKNLPGRLEPVDPDSLLARVFPRN